MVPLSKSGWFVLVRCGCVVAGLATLAVTSAGISRRRAVGGSQGGRNRGRAQGAPFQ